MAIQLGSAYGKVSLDTSGVQKGVESAINGLSNLSVSMAQMGEAISNIGAGLTLAATVPLALFAKSAITASNESEAALANLNAVIKSTGDVSGVTADQAEAMAKAFQDTTMFSDETIINGEAMLLTFTKIGKDIFPQATEAMLNMGQKFGSVQNAAIQLGKALQDPEKGVTVLRRVGVMLSDEQEKQVKHFVAVNDIASAQKVILNELQTEFGGLATAVGGADGGKIQQFWNTLDDIKEKVGKDLKNIFIPFIESLTNLMRTFMNFPEPVRKMILDLGVLAGTLVAAAGPLLFFAGKIMKLPFLIEQTGTLIETVLIPAMGGLIDAILPALVPLLALAGTIYLVYLGFKNNFMGMADIAKKAWSIITTALQSMHEAFDKMLPRIMTAWNLLKGPLFDLWNALQPILKLLAPLLISVLITIGAMLVGVMGAMTGFLEYIGQAIEGIATVLKGLVELITGVMDIIVGIFTLDGEKILEGFGELGNGIVDIFVGAFNTLIGLVHANLSAFIELINSVLSYYQGVSAEINTNPIYANGLASGSRKGSMKNFGISDPAAMAKPTQGTKDGNRNITIHLSSGLTLRQAQEMLTQNNNFLLTSLIDALD